MGGSSYNIKTVTEVADRNVKKNCRTDAMTFRQEGVVSVPGRWKERIQIKMRKNITKIAAMALFLLATVIFAGIPARAEVVELLSGTSASGTVEGDNPKVYKYIMPEDGTFDFSLEGSYRIYTHVYDSAGTVYYENEASCSTNRGYGFRKGEEVYIKIHSRWGDKQSYDLNIQFEARNDYEMESNNVPEKANPIQLGNTYQGHLLSEGDVDYFSFHVDRACGLTMQLGSASVIEESSNSVWVFGLYNKTEDTRELWSRSANTQSVRENLYLQPGDYLLKVSVGSRFYSSRYSISLMEHAVNPAAPKAAAKASKGKVTLSWTPVSYMDGYEIQYSRNKNFKNAQFVSSSSEKKTISGLASGKVYYFRVRSYVKDLSGEKICSSYSAAKAVKVK